MLNIQRLYPPWLGGWAAKQTTDQATTNIIWGKGGVTCPWATQSPEPPGPNHPLKLVGATQVAIGTQIWPRFHAPRTTQQQMGLRQHSVPATKPSLRLQNTSEKWAESCAQTRAAPTVSGRVGRKPSNPHRWVGGRTENCVKKKGKHMFLGKKNICLPRGQETHCTSYEWVCNPQWVHHSLSKPEEQTANAERRMHAAHRLWHKA